MYGLKGPHGDFERNTTSECWVLVPPSAHIRMYQPSWRYRWGPSIQIGFFAGSTPPLTSILRGPTNFRVAASNGDVALASERAAEALAICALIDERFLGAMCIVGLADALQPGTRTARLLGTADGLRMSVGAKWPMLLAKEYRRAIVKVYTRRAVAKALERARA